MSAQVLSFLFLLPILVSAQIDEWGIGVLELPYENNEFIHVYDRPNGTIEGTLGMERNIHNTDFRILTWRDGEHGGPRMHIPKEALIEIGYEIDGLVVRKEEDGFLKIMYPKGELTAWVSLEELTKAGFLYYSWKKFMLRGRQTFFTMSYGMNLRERPGIDGTYILTVKGDQFEIELTGKSEGLWAEVVVKEFSTIYCEEPHKLVNTYTGWMKILDDKGYPNLWFYARGC